MLTPLEKYKIPTPMGINEIPITKKVGKTVPAVKIGCHAGNFCCLNALSKNKKDYNLFLNIIIHNVFYDEYEYIIMY